MVSKHGLVLQMSWLIQFEARGTLDFRTNRVVSESCIPERIARLLEMRQTYKLLTTSAPTTRTRLMLQFLDLVIWRRFPTVFGQFPTVSTVSDSLLG